MPHIRHQEGDRLPQMARILAIDERIRRGDYPSGPRMAKSFDVSPKTIERDLQYLRYTLDAPLEYDESRKGWYYTRKDFFLPMRFVSKSDYQAVMVLGEMIAQYAGTPLGETMQRAFQRLLELFKTEETTTSKRGTESGDVAAKRLAGRICFARPPSSPINTEVWESILKALQHDQRLEITYKKGGSGPVSTRSFDPYGLIVRDRDWYLYGYCHLDEARRTLGLPFIQRAALLNDYFGVPAGFDLREHVHSGFQAMHAENQPERRVVLRFSPLVAGRVECRPFTYNQTVTREKSGHVLVAFKATALFRVEREILAWGDQVEVIGPKELRDSIAETARGMVRQYARAR